MDERFVGFIIGGFSAIFALCVAAQIMINKQKEICDLASKYDSDVRMVSIYCYKVASGAAVTRVDGTEIN